MSKEIQDKIIDTLKAVNINKELGYTITIYKESEKTEPNVYVNIHIPVDNKESSQYLHLINHYHDKVQSIGYKKINLRSDMTAAQIAGYIISE